jgi:hypothetical protein
MWSIENIGAVGSAGRADVLRPLTFQNLTTQFVSAERFPTHRKQTTVLCSNRQKINFCKTASVNVIGARVGNLRAFLTGSASQTEIAATHSKQSTVPQSNRARIAQLGADTIQQERSCPSLPTAT